MKRRFDSNDGYAILLVATIEATFKNTEETMIMALNLLKAPHVGVREFKDNISALLKKRGLLIVTEHGEPMRVVVPYEDMLEILDIMEEINDRETAALISEGRKAVRSGSKGIPVFKNGKIKP